MIKDIIKEGFLFKKAGHYKYALEKFYKALSEEESSLELLLEIAETYYLMHKNELALSYIEKILNINHAHVESLKLLKTIFEDNKKYDESIQTSKNIYAITKNPKDIAELLGTFNKAMRYTEAIEFPAEQTIPEIIYEKALAYFKVGELETALEMAKTLINEDSQNKYLLLYGNILFSLNKMTECENLTHKFDLSNNDNEILNFIGLIHRTQGNYAEALNYFNKAVKINPKKDIYYYNIASTYLKMENYYMAKQYYNKAIILNPNNQNYHFALGNLLYREKQYRRALKELDSDLFEARLLKAIILYDTGYLVLAKKELDIIESQSPEDPVLKEYKLKIKEKIF